MKQAIAKLNNLKIAPRKVRLQADLVRGMPVAVALAQLQVSRLRSSGPLGKLIKSAIANARMLKMDAHKLVVKTIFVDKGIMLKRYLPRARGSASELQKKFSHVTVILEESATAKQPEYRIHEAPKKAKKAEKPGAKPKAGKGSETGAEEKTTKKSAPNKPGFFRQVFNRKSV